jgi:bifunctional UDP-N-acetylglucosamine pyrophosphorylase / glucosamine-1-phosphate N-acetyltransferase
MSSARPHSLTLRTVYEGALRLGYEESVVHFAHQAEQKGTGHATACALPELRNFRGTVLILYGDVPLISRETLQQFLTLHEARRSTVSLISFVTSALGRYGRIIRDSSGQHVAKVVEARDCDPRELLINEVNAGVYAVDSAFLEPALKDLSSNNSQGEYYLTDIVERANKEGQTVCVYLAPDAEEFLGVNTRSDLAHVNEVLVRRRIERVIESGVTVKDRRSVYIGPEVVIGVGSVLGPQVYLYGKTSLAEGVVVEGSCYLVDCKVEKQAQLRFGIRAEGSIIGTEAKIGPFAHLRPGTILDERVKVGNFVETKNAHLHADVSASHLTYLGDCEVGSATNIGAGTITCNYDGFTKFKTTIGENVFIGSNTCLVAPITIESGATIGAGSVLQEDLPANALGLTRAPLKVKENYNRRRKA